MAVINALSGFSSFLSMKSRACKCQGCGALRPRNILLSLCKILSCVHKKIKSHAFFLNLHVFCACFYTFNVTFWAFNEKSSFDRTRKSILRRSARELATLLVRDWQAGENCAVWYKHHPSFPCPPYLRRAPASQPARASYLP